MTLSRKARFSNEREGWLFSALEREESERKEGFSRRLSENAEEVGMDLSPIVLFRKEIGAVNHRFGGAECAFDFESTNKIFGEVFGYGGGFNGF